MGVLFVGWSKTTHGRMASSVSALDVFPSWAWLRLVAVAVAPRTLTKLNGSCSQRQDFGYSLLSSDALVTSSRIAKIVIPITGYAVQHHFRRLLPVPSSDRDIVRYAAQYYFRCLLPVPSSDRNIVSHAVQHRFRRLLLVAVLSSDRNISM